MISHRPATILWVDRILVVDEEAIADSGKHQKLILRREATKEYESLKTECLCELFTSNVERRNDGWREDSRIRAVSVMQVEFRIKNWVPNPTRCHNYWPSVAPFESPFAPSAASTFTTNFVPVTVDKCYVRIVHITLKIKMKNLSIRLLLVRYIGSGEFRAVETGWRSEGEISGNVGRR